MPHTRLPAPRNAWYPMATTVEVGRAPLARRCLETPIVLFRTSDGTAAALADRSSPRPYPLSLGRVEGDTLVCGYSGFAYAADGTCLRVPTQAVVPLDANVRAFPVHDDGVLVWVWLGQSAVAAFRPPPRAPWLNAPDWVTFGSEWETKAGLPLLQDNFADITHVAIVDPFIAPPVLAMAPPPLEVGVTETSVTFSRTFPPAPVPAWQAELMGVAMDAAYAQREEGTFVSPGLWIDRWDVTVTGHGDADGIKTFRFTHALTPIDARSTRHVWRVSRNFAPGAAATATFQPIFTDYYRKMKDILETMQGVIDTDGPATTVNVTADAALIQVRKIMHRLVRDEAATH